jgi:hypothetical protein
MCVFCAFIEDFIMTALAAICFILFKVRFDFELLSMCIYAYLLI